ncbi:MAG: galactose-1-phosphate uridylyltransferase, partial [Deltaproteobacteria bacterium]|nr:galactose-1-phosphate uridylyltransferase [Deltaproteobacteria bacterium]
MPELRKDIVTREWVVIAKERAKRPDDLAHTKKALEEIPEHDPGCPFCTGNEDKTPPEVLVYRPVNSGPNSPGWLLRVTPNKYQALIGQGDLNRENHHIYDHMNGVGAHEVVIECPEHNQTLATM